MGDATDETREEVLESWKRGLDVYEEEDDAMPKLEIEEEEEPDNHVLEELHHVKRAESWQSQRLSQKCTRAATTLRTQKSGPQRPKIQSAVEQMWDPEMRPDNRTQTDKEDPVDRKELATAAEDSECGSANAGSSNAPMQPHSEDTKENQQPQSTHDR